MPEANRSLEGRRRVGYTRREFVTSSAAASLGLVGASAVPTNVAGHRSMGTAQEASYTGYVSFRPDDRVSIFTMDPRTGTLTWREHVTVEGGPGPLAMDPGNRFLYVASRDSQELRSFGIDPTSGGLSLIGTVPLQGETVQMTTDQTGRFLLGAYLYQSTAAVHALGGDGAIGFPPIEWRYTAYGAHGIHVDPSNRFVFVPHLARSGGPNAIAQFGFDDRTGLLTPSDPPFLHLEEYLGPRHLTFHPTLDVAYSSDEQGSSATAYRVDRSTGTLTNFQTISTVPSDYVTTTQVTCSQLRIHPSGNFLFVITRGHDSITSFAVDASTGRLAVADRVPTEPGARPLCLDPEGRFLISAGGGMSDHGRVATYRIGQDTGSLTPLEIYEGGRGPMWILLTRLSG